MISGNLRHCRAFSLITLTATVNFAVRNWLEFKIAVIILKAYKMNFLTLFGVVQVLR